VNDGRLFHIDCFSAWMFSIFNLIQKPIISDSKRQNSEWGKTIPFPEYFFKKYWFSSLL